MHCAASGTSTLRESRIGFPISSVSRSASSSACSSTSSAKRLSTFLRSRGPRAPDGAVDVAGLAGRDARDLDARRRVHAWKRVPALGVGRLPVDPGLRTDAEARDESCDVTNLGCFELCHRRHRTLLALTAWWRAWTM